MTASSRIRFVVGLFVVAVSAVCVYAIRQVDPDFYGYLAYGRLFASLGHPTAADPFAYTNAGFHWVAFEYLAQTAIWEAYARGGPIGLIALKCVLGGATILCMWLAVRETTDDLLVSVPIFLLCTTTASRYFLFRPQLITFACFAIFVAVIFRFLLRGRAPLGLLPCVMLPWVNAHGGFLAGLGAIGLAMFLRAVSQDDAPLSWRARMARTRPLVVTFVACAAVTFVNPQGLRLWGYVLVELFHDTNRRYINEWRPASWTNDPWSLVVLAFMVVVMVVVAPIAARSGRRVGGLSAWAWAASAAPLLLMTTASVRHVALAAIWGAPVLALLAQMARRSGWTLFRTFWLAVLGPACFIPVALAMEFVAMRPKPVIAADGSLLGGHSPCGVTAFLRANHIQGNAFLPLWWGSYVTWENYPDIRVSMDGRNISAFPDAMVAENLRFFSPDVTTADLDVPLRYSTDFLIVPSNMTVLDRVQSDPRWRAIFADSDAVLFVRADAAHAGIAARVMTPPADACSPVLH